MSSPAAALAAAALAAKAKARETAKDTPLENATTLRGIYNDCTDPTLGKDGFRFPEWVLEDNRWTGGDTDKHHKFDDTIVVYDDDASLNEVKELVEKREPVNIAMNRANYDLSKLETNFGWKHGAYEKSTSSELYPNIGIYCHARVTNGVSPGAGEKNVHVMNLIGYAFDSIKQPDYIYFLDKYKITSADSTKVMVDSDETNKKQFKEDLIQRYRKIWLKACYICKLKGLKNLWYYGVGSGFFSRLLPKEYNKDSGKFYQEIFAPAFGIDPTDVSESPKNSTLNDTNDLDIPINFCKKYNIHVLNLGTSSSKQIPDVLFTEDTTPADTLYINAWDPWSIIGNGNAADGSLDGHWGRNSNMSVLGWSMTNSKLLPDITGGGDSDRKSKILSMKEILDKINAKDVGSSASPSVSGDPPSGKVAQFFMTFLSDDKKNGGLSGYNQCKKIVNAVKCLMAKGYKNIGLTYSANQEQTNKIWKEYNYPNAKDFDNKQEKTILETGIDGTGQARTIGIHNKQELQGDTYVDIHPSVPTTHIDDLTSDTSDENSNFRKAFRIIPFSTMKTGGGTTEVTLDSPGDINECIEAAKKFLELENSIILGWCNQEIETLTDLNKDSFNKDYTPDDAGKFPFAIGGGVGGKSKLPILFSTYLKEYFKFLTSNWSEDVQKIVTSCSPDPKSANSPVSLSPPATPSKPKEDLGKVIEGLVNRIKDTEDTDTTTLGIKPSSSSFIYEYPPSDASSPPPSSPPPQKNLNSADPAIGDMIKEFETATTDDATKTTRDFYLGACRSIQAAYELEMSGITGSDASANDKKMRAKLLLNLRKNSLLLKVPKGWDYATMQPGVEVEPELTPPFSVPLQNESGVFCFENVGFQLLFSIDSVRKFSEKTLKEIDATTLCNSLSIETDRPKCNIVIVNTYDVLHKMSEQYKQDKSVAVEAKESKRKLEEIKNIEVTEVYTQDGSNQADAADFLIMTILQYLKLYEPINNSVCFKQYELTLCTHDIDNSNLDINIDGLDKLYKYETIDYTDKTKNKYDFSKNSLLQKIGVKIDNTKLLDIVNPVGVEQNALMCFTNGYSIQECIDDYLSEKKLEINNDTLSATYEEQTELADISKCEKENTIKRSVLYIPETQKYLIVTLKRYTLNKGKTIIITKEINVSEKITINADETYGKKVEFKLRGVICKTGSAGGGHYVYISYENDKKILYNDYNPPTEFKGHEYDINTTGYVFLYEKNINVQAGGRNIIHTTTHSTTASKSKHNSSFKASSSSKSKGKSHSRSHTQRVK